MLHVFDFFSGCGGTSLGFKNAGFKIVGGLDFDKDAATTFSKNFPEAKFLNDDIRNINASDLSEIFTKKRKVPLLFCGCAPCQPFSGQRKFIRKNDERRYLLSEFQRFVEYWQPEYIFLENVPGIQNINKSGTVFKSFTDKLSENYNYDMQVVKAYDLGVPQLRKRFILIAAKKELNLSPIKNIISKYCSLPKPTVKDIIFDLPPVKAGQSHIYIPNHEAARLTPINVERIKATPEGGDRRDWPSDLRPNCHNNYGGHTDVYGRMKWDAPAATLTTKCISYSNGRFGHPKQNRAITVREAARLQTFPDDFVFYGSLGSTARQVGNAVPPLMSQRLAEVFM